MDPVSLIPGLRRNADNSIALCPPCSKNGCCPSIVFDETDGSAVVSDEGQSVRFTAAQLDLLGQAVMMRKWLAHGSPSSDSVG